MYKSTIIDIFRSFNKADIKEFGVFIQSPFFNTNQSVVKLYEQIKKLYPEFEENLSDKKLLFERAFGKIKYNDSFMRMTVFRMLELIKEFLIYRNLQRNDLMKETLLLDELNFRELNNLMMKSIYYLDKKIEKQKAKNAETYFVKYRLEYFKNDVKARDTKMITYKDTLDEDLMNEQKNLNAFFFISSLKFFQYFLNQKDFVINAEGYPDFINSILEYLKSGSEYLIIPVLKVYYNLVLLLISKKDKYFFELKKMLFEDKDDLTHTDKYNVITVLRNYGSRKYSEGNKEFIDSVFDILKFSIEKDLLTSSPGSKYINEARFTHIAWTGIKAKDFNWVEEFLKKYIIKIEPEKRQYVFAFNISRLEFEKGNYSEALEQLGKSGPIKNVFYKANIKQLTLMIYYELQWLIPAADLLDAFRHFIRTDKLLPELYKTSFISFINFFNRLLKIKDGTKNNFLEISVLISELKSTSQIWLLKKAKEIERDKKVNRKNSDRI